MAAVVYRLGIDLGVVDAEADEMTSTVRAKTASRQVLGQYQPPSPTRPQRCRCYRDAGWRQALQSTTNRCPGVGMGLQVPTATEPDRPTVGSGHARWLSPIVGRIIRGWQRAIGHSATE